MADDAASRRAAADQARGRMVSRDLAARGISDPRVLEAMGVVPRELFVPDDLVDLAYEDRALPIEEGQTISQPYIVALTVEALRLSGAERVLDVGTGSGYAAAVLGRLAVQVWGIERHELLVDRARANLAAAGADNVTVVHGDGMLGHPADAPYDAIAVAAAAAEIPTALVEQLAEGGRLVIPVGRDGGAQELVRLTRVGDRIERENLLPVRFVPLLPGSGLPRR
jgi:protein-L-isoaspartate(D-aspartate) O-methyltransferase